MANYHNLYNRNVWITEFAGIDYGNNFTAEQMQVWNAEFLSIVLPELDSRSYVTRYAWWNFNDDSRLVAENSYGLYEPTKAGDPYVNTIANNQTRDFAGASRATEMQYLRGGSLLNNGADLGNLAAGRVFALRNPNNADTGAVDTTEVVSVIGGSGNWGLYNWGSLTVDQYARLQKSGTGNVTLRDIDIYNDGQIQITGGTNNSGALIISGAGTKFYGDGSIRLNSSSTLRLGDAADTAGFTLPYALDFRGGTIFIDGPGIKLSGKGSVFSQLTLNAAYDLSITGIWDGTAGIAKNGAGTLTLSGNQTYARFTTVQAGKLQLNGSLAGNNVLVKTDATLAGTGSIASLIDVSPGGSVILGNNATVGTISAAAATFADSSLLSFDLASRTSFDRLVLSGTLDFSANATLQFGLLNGFKPAIGDQFDVLDFQLFKGQFANINAPALTTGRWDFSALASTGVISVVAIPEPTIVGLMLTSACVALLARRRIGVCGDRKQR